MATFAADQIINKTLYAKKELNKRREPSTDSEIVGTTEVGQAVGKVFSYVNGKDARLWWMFLPANGTPFYVAHKEGNFSQTALKEQGAQTVSQVAQAEIDKNKTWYEKAAESASESASDTYGTVKKIAIGAAILAALYFISQIVSNVKK